MKIHISDFKFSHHLWNFENAEFQKKNSFIFFLLKNIRDFRPSLDLANAPKFTIFGLILLFSLTSHY